MTNVTIAAVQCSFSNDTKENLDKIEELVSQAQKKGAEIICLPELFESRYFCQHEREESFSLAKPLESHPTIDRLSRLAKVLKVSFPVSFFEKDGPHYYNSIVMLDSDGKNLGLYRKSHIPDGPGYEEKFYFRPGNTGFKIWKTSFANVGVGICWDQWFPEAARAMTLQGADILLYPTAIGSEPEQPDLHTKDPWQRVMIGHAVANATYLVAANRIGVEDAITFYGHSFICNQQGEKAAELSSCEEDTIVAGLNLQELQAYRASFGFFRDRRPELYGALTPMK